MPAIAGLTPVPHPCSTSNACSFALLCCASTCASTIGARWFPGKSGFRVHSSSIMSASNAIASATGCLFAFFISLRRG